MMIITDTNGHNYVPENDTTFTEAGTYIVNFIATKTGNIKPSGLNTIIDATPMSFIGKVNNIFEPISVDNDSETDAIFRTRIQNSDSINSRGMPQSIKSQIDELDGVIEGKIYQNSTGFIDENGLPPYTFYSIVDGGDNDKTAEILCKNIGNNQMKEEAHCVINVYTMSFDRTNQLPFYVGFKLKLLDTEIIEGIKQNISNKMAELSITNKTFQWLLV